MEENKSLNALVTDADLKLAVENAYDHVVVTDKDGLIIYANRGVERVTGFSINEVIGTKAGKLWGGLMKPEFYVMMWNQLINEKRPWIGEITNKRKDGTRYTADVRVSPILDDKGEILKFVGIERDITVFKQAEELAARETAIISALADCLVVTDKEGKIQRVNKVFEETMGFNLAEIQGQALVKVLPKLNEKGETVPDNQRLLILVLNGELPKTQLHDVSETYYYYHKNGQKIPIAGEVTPIVINGEIVGAVQVFRDITKEKEIEQMRTDVLSQVSHQLKTPIGQLQAYLDNLLSGVVGTMTASQQEYLANMYQVLNRLTKMTTNILNASRIERGIIEVNLQPVEVNKIISQIMGASHQAAQAKGLDLSYEGTENIMVMADEIKLTEVINNVVDNAVKFTEKGRVAVTVSTQANMVIIEVKDTGPGMSQTQLETIFLRNKGTEQALTAKTGSRLGMYIAKIFIEKQKGDIQVTSIEGEGTTFKIFIPLANS